MKAVAKLKPTDAGIDVVDVREPTLRDRTDVIVRVEYSGISGSEINIWRGTYRRPNGSPVESGRILGYEHAGIVVDAGPEAAERGFAPGASVALASPFIGCGSCDPCADGMINRCRAWGHIGITLDGTNANLARLPMAALELIPEGVDHLDAAFLNSAALAVRAVARAALVPGDGVVVIGPGPVGLLLLQAARAGGAAWIAVVGRPEDQARLTIANQLGADATITFHEGVAEELRETSGGGAAVVLEAAGTPEAMELSVDALRVGGTAVFAGLPPERHASIEAIRVTRDELTIRGVEGNLPPDRRRALALIANGKLSAVPFVTHRFSLDEAESAFAVVASGAACKAVFTPA